MRILIAAEDIYAAEAICFMLEKEHYTIDIAHSEAEVLAHIRQTRYHALVIDLSFADAKDIRFLETIRELDPAVPILFLTDKTTGDERAAILNGGADDCLSKPAAASELSARLHILTRRNAAHDPAILAFGNIRLDCHRYLLSSADKSLRLNNREYQLMALFMRNPRCIFSTEHLMEKIWGLETETEIDVVWTYIGFLRKKLRSLSAEIEIRTIRGAGYILEEVSGEMPKETASQPGTRP